MKKKRITPPIWRVLYWTTAIIATGLSIRYCEDGVYPFLVGLAFVGPVCVVKYFNERIPRGD